MDRKPRALVSACLLGAACRYDGGSQALNRRDALLERCEVVPVCPEQLGGLPTPRTPSERREGRVVSRDGADVTDAFARGAEALRLAGLPGREARAAQGQEPLLRQPGDLRRQLPGAAVPRAGADPAQALVDAGIAFNERQIALEDFPDAERK